MEGTGKPDYGKAVDMLTKAAIKEMIVPSLLPVAVPVASVACCWARRPGRPADGHHRDRHVRGDSMTTGGGVGTTPRSTSRTATSAARVQEAHKAAVTGDTVGDPYKDTAGPAVNPLIKIINIAQTGPRLVPTGKNPPDEINVTNPVKYEVDKALARSSSTASCPPRCATQQLRLRPSHRSRRRRPGDAGDPAAAAGAGFGDPPYPGMLKMTDEAGGDEDRMPLPKIFGGYAHIVDIEQVSPHWLERIGHFFGAIRCDLEGEAGRLGRRGGGQGHPQRWRWRAAASTPDAERPHF